MSTDFQSGYEAGEVAGYEKGYAEGHNIGYEEGKLAATCEELTVVDLIKDLLDRGDYDFAGKLMIELNS